MGGYLIVWGSPAQRDLQGEYFTPETELGLGWYDRRPALYHHGLDGDLKSPMIGTIDRLVADETGVWAEAQLDLRHRYVRAIQRLVERGILGWSSGSLPHLVEVADDGRIKRWPIVEGSLTPAPAEPRQTDVQTIKSAYSALGLDVARLDIENEAGDASIAPTVALGQRALERYRAPEFQRKGVVTMQDETNTLDLPRKRLPLASAEDAVKHIQVGSPYDTLDAMDLLHGYMLLRSAKHFHGVSERYANALAHKVRQAGLSAVKSDELSYSTQASFGDEWVPDLWSAQIWQRARLENVILPLFQSVEMPSNPVRAADLGRGPDGLLRAGDERRGSADAGGGQCHPRQQDRQRQSQLAAKKLALRVGFSSELVEDAVVPVLNIYREQAVRAITDSIDYVLLNGDTATQRQHQQERRHAGRDRPLHGFQRAAQAAAGDEHGQRVRTRPVRRLWRCCGRRASRWRPSMPRGRAIWPGSSMAGPTPSSWAWPSS